MTNRRDVQQELAPMETDAFRYPFGPGNRNFALISLRVVGRVLTNSKNRTFMDANSRGTTTPNYSLAEVSVGSSNNEGSCQSYWERLPAEIMEDIFLMCRPLEKRRPPCKTHAPYLLTHVCRSWYKFVVGLAKMWSTVVLTTANDSDTISPSRLEAGTRHLAMCITRSKAAPRELCIRAEFVANPTSFEYIQCVEWQRLVLVFPSGTSNTPSNTHPPFFPPAVRMIMPTLIVLEVYSRRTISHSDQVVLSGIIDSAQALKRHVSPKNASINTPRQLSLPNMSNLEVLTLHQHIPISACPFILQSAPSLRKLSLAFGIVPPGDELISRGMKPLHTLTQPFIHPHLEYLALAHFKCDLSDLFERVTLPLVHFLLLDSRGSWDQAIWPHNKFIAFLRRSGCKLTSFHILDQLIPPSCFLELLRLPHLADSLEYLGIQNYVGEEPIIDDSVLEELTLPSVTSQAEAIPTTFALDSRHPRSSPPLLCPNIERLILFVPFEGFTLSNLIAMFYSRLPSNNNAVVPHKTLRQVEMDLCEEMEGEFESLCENGLVLTLFESASADAIPLDEEQQKLWRRHLSEGLDDEVYDHVTGTWRPSDTTLQMC